MTIRDLEIFVAVAESGRMGTAARKLYISQPTVSHVITKIEETYHVCLFERLSRKLYITETGQELLQYARHILANFKDMEHYLYHASEQLCINIGASLTVGTAFLADMVSEFEKANPKISIRVYVDNTHDIVRKITEGTLDIAIVEGSVPNTDVVTKVVYDDEMVLICGKSHPFASRKSICLEDLRNADCILREEGSGTRDFLINLTEKKGIPIVKKWVCHSSDSIIRIVAAGQGVSMLSKSLVQNVPQVVQVPVKGPKLHRKFRIVYHRDKYLSTPLKRLIEEMQLYFRKISMRHFASQ